MGTAGSTVPRYRLWVQASGAPAALRWDQTADGPWVKAEDYDQALAAARPQWQPIETAPKDGSWILVWSKHEVYRASWGRNRNGNECWCTSYGWLVNATHWMPLPEPPQ